MLYTLVLYDAGYIKAAPYIGISYRSTVSRQLCNFSFGIDYRLSAHYVIFYQSYDDTDIPFPAGNVDRLDVGSGG
jgi:hypothetical protein